MDNNAMQPQQPEKKGKEITNEKIYKALMVNRVLTIITLVLMIAFVIIGGVVFYKVNNLIKELEPMIQLMQEIDLEGINNVLHTANEVFGQIDWDKTAEALSKFDVDGINEMVSSFDINKLNTAIDNINSAYETMEDVSNKLQPVLNFFGGTKK